VTAKEIYRQLERLVDEACQVESFLIAIKGAEAIGMVGGRIEENIFNLDYEFKFDDNTGAGVVLKFHSYDQSRAFDVQPDMNKFEVILTHETGIAEIHKNEYEG